MANLRDIKKRINSVTSTKQITRTMEMVATAKIKRATDRIVAATPYATVMVEVLKDVARRTEDSTNPLLIAHEEIKNVAVIAIVSDRGLAGGFNSGVLRAADRFVQQMQDNNVNCKIIACGKKAGVFFNYRKLPIALALRDSSSDPTINDAEKISSFVIDNYLKGEIDQVVIFYNHARNVADQVLSMEQVLPITLIETHAVNEGSDDTVLLDESAKAAAAGSTEKMAAAQKRAEQLQESNGSATGFFEYEPSAEVVLNELLPTYVKTRIYHALLDSAAGEQGARRKAMKAATDNATEMIATLMRVYNRARQGAITTEISEIVGGAAALEEE